MWLVVFGRLIGIMNKRNETFWSNKLIIEDNVPLVT